MKRLIALLTVSLAVLVGCSVDQVRDSTDKFVEEVKDMKLAENSKITGSLKKELISEREGLLDKIANSLELKGSRELSENDEFNKLKDNLREYQSELKYKVENVEMNSDKTKASAVVDIEYFDIGELAKTSLNDALDRNVFKIYGEKEVSADEFLSEVFASMNESLEKWESEELISIENAKLSIVELDGEWIIDEIDNDVLNAITLGVHKSLTEGLKEKLETVIDNKKFLEIESNLLAAFNEMEKEIDDIDNLRFSDLEGNGDEIASRISERINREVKWGEESAVDDVYYIYEDKDKNEIVVKVNIDGEEYKLTKETVVD